VRDRHVALVGPAHHHERNGRLSGLERRLQVVDPHDGRAVRGHDQVALLDPGARGRTAVLDPAHQHAVALRQAHGPTQPPRHMRRCDRHAQPRGRNHLAARQAVDALAQ
jgi:hypothetical protein